MCHLSDWSNRWCGNLRSEYSKTMDVSNSSAIKRFIISPNGINDNAFGFDYYHLNHTFNPLLMCGRVRQKAVCTLSIVNEMVSAVDC